MVRRQRRSFADVAERQIGCSQLQIDRVEIVVIFNFRSQFLHGGHKIRILFPALPLQRHRRKNAVAVIEIDLTVGKRLLQSIDCLVGNARRLQAKPLQMSHALQVIHRRVGNAAREFVVIAALPAAECQVQFFQIWQRCDMFQSRIGQFATLDEQHLRCRVLLQKFEILVCESSLFVAVEIQTGNLSPVIDGK